MDFRVATKGSCHVPPDTRDDREAKEGADGALMIGDLPVDRESFLQSVCYNEETRGKPGLLPMRTSRAEKRLDLRTLAESCPHMTAAAGRYLADAAAVALEAEGHGHEMVLRATSHFRASYLLQRSDVTESMRASYDVEEATEFGACGIAILVMRDQTGFTVRRAYRGGGFDYWLGPADGARPFQNHARLEVSGIRRGDRRQIGARVKQKLGQVRPDRDSLPAYVVVVEFSRPEARVERR